ncbi:hypothetical protein GCM10023196_038650 [Actinoallomurus vinaceus]|uniref:Uncharacterized protein n=2 Tax=Actinoallomurus vinaceus TaxID=1080074 RepID=A0ABP8UAE9_9ACTN
MPGILTPDELTELRDLITARGPGSILRRHFRRLLDRAMAEGISAVRHPLGFLCVPVLRSADVGVCIHLWTDTVRCPPLTTSPVHAHSWNLTSFVLFGQVRNHLFRVEDAADHPTHRVLAVYTDGLVDELQPTRRLVTCEEATRQVIESDRTYLLSAGRFHATSVRGPAATIVVADIQRSTPEYALGHLGLGRHQVRRRRCAARELLLAAGAFDRLHDLDMSP